MTRRYRLIILHAGLGKTGTTSIQGNCYRHRELLLEHGIVYPAFKFGEKYLVNHSDCIIADICENPGKYGAGFRQQVQENPQILADEISPQMTNILKNPQADTLVLSGEAIAEFGNIDMQALLHKLQAHTEQLRVVAYIRSPQSSLESILQQRVKTNRIDDPEELVCVVRQRYERLQLNFADLLETVNFHTAIKHQYGLVGHFMEFIGVPLENLKGLEYSTSNERVSLEAYKIMVAINQRYPRSGTDEHGIVRQPHDMQSVVKLPGQPFQLEGFVGSKLYQQLLEESAWLEDKLNFHFPELEQKSTSTLWQENSLITLEAAIRSLNNKHLEAAATEFLREEAGRLASTRKETASILFHIAWSLEAIETNPTQAILEQLGADYFKFAALQVEHGSSELALKLMSIAKELRPEAKFIESRIKKYKEKLGSSK